MPKSLPILKIYLIFCKHVKSTEQELTILSETKNRIQIVILISVFMVRHTPQDMIDTFLELYNDYVFEKIRSFLTEKVSMD